MAKFSFNKGIAVLAITFKLCLCNNGDLHMVFYLIANIFAKMGKNTEEFMDAQHSEERKSLKLNIEFSLKSAVNDYTHM